MDDHVLAALHPDTDAKRDQAAQSASIVHPADYTDGSPIRIKKFGHLVYEVTDVERTVRFWTKVMGFKETERNAKGMVFLRYNPDHHGLGIKPGKANRPGRRGECLRVEHLALEVEDIDALIAARDYLKKNNIPIVFEGRKGPAGNTSIHCLDPDGFEFELYCCLDQIDESGRPRPKEQFHPTSTLEEAKANPMPKTW
jgi:catechol 2,3-dioxygenase-like lactoylglutathione lyase family enzyme